MDADGSVLATGLFSGAIDFGGGPLVSAGLTDIFVAKLDRTGVHLWSQAFGDASNQNGNGITVDSMGNVLVAGYFEGEVDFGGGPLVSAGWFDASSPSWMARAPTLEPALARERSVHRRRRRTTHNVSRPYSTAPSISAGVRIGAMTTPSWRSSTFESTS
jgi:hypothetical protein